MPSLESDVVRRRLVAATLLAVALVIVLVFAAGRRQGDGKLAALDSGSRQTEPGLAIADAGSDDSGGADESAHPPAETPADFLPLTEDGDLSLVLEIRFGQDAVPPHVRLAFDPLEAAPSGAAAPRRSGTTIAFGPMIMPKVPRHLAQRFRVSIQDAAVDKNYVTWGHASLAAAIRREVLLGKVQVDPSGGQRYVVVSYAYMAESATGLDVVVQTNDGTPIAGAEILVDDLARGRTTDVGRFETAVTGGRHELRARLNVLGVGYLERQQTVDAPSGGPALQVVFTLESRGSISGVARWRDGTPIDGIEIVATDPAYEFRQLKNTFYRPEGAAPWVSAITDAGGGFYLTGVIGLDRVALWWRQDDGTMRRAVDLVAVGSRNTVLVLDRHRLRLFLRDAKSGREITGQIAVNELDGQTPGPHRPTWESHRPRGTNEFVISPGSRLRVTARALGYRTQEAELQAEGRDYVEVRYITLEPGSDGHEVRIDFTDDRGYEVPAPPAELLDASGRQITLGSTVAVKSSVYASDVPAGELQIAVDRPVGLPTVEKWKFFLPQVAHVRVAEGNDNHCAVRLTRGGLIKVRHNIERAARLSLLDGAGKTVAVQWHVKNQATLEETPILAGQGEAQSTAIVSGTYRLRLIDQDGVVVERDVVVHVGAMTDVSL